MSAHPPPVPREQQSDKAPAKAPASGRAETDQTDKAKSPSVDSNANRFGDIKQNTRNKGHQQDR